MFAMMDLDTGFLNDPRLGKRDLKVLIALCAHADRQDGGCFPSRERISEITGLHLSKISPATRKLEELRYIRKFFSKAGNRYQVIRFQKEK